MTVVCISLHSWYTDGLTAGWLLANCQELTVCSYTLTIGGRKRRARLSSDIELFMSWTWCLFGMAQIGWLIDTYVEHFENQILICIFFVNANKNLALSLATHRSFSL